MAKSETNPKTPDTYGVPKEGELFDTGRALNRLIQVMHPKKAEKTENSPMQIGEFGGVSESGDGALGIQDKAFDFWVRAAKTIADLHNPNVRSVIICETENDNSLRDSTVDELRDENITNIRNKVNSLSLKDAEQLRVDYRLLSSDKIMGNAMNDSLLWRAVPIAASEEDSRIAGLVRLQNDKFLKASEPDKSLRPINPSK